jgi:RNA polymerase primary sigma factor
MIDKIRLVKKAITEISCNSDKEVKPEEIAEKLKMSVKQVELVLNTIKLEPISLDTPIADNLALEDYIADDNYISPENLTQNIMLKVYIEKILKELNPKEKKIISARFGIDGNKPKTLEELGKDMGFSKERIRQIEATAIKKLKANDKIKHLKDFLL